MDTLEVKAGHSIACEEGREDATAKRRAMGLTPRIATI